MRNFSVNVRMLDECLSVELISKLFVVVDSLYNFHFHKGLAILETFPCCTLNIISVFNDTSFIIRVEHVLNCFLLIM